MLTFVTLVKNTCFRKRKAKIEVERAKMVGCQGFLKFFRSVFHNAKFRNAEKIPSNSIYFPSIVHLCPYLFFFEFQ